MKKSWIWLGAGFLLLAWAERRRPLRRRVEEWLPHSARNAALAATSLLVTQKTEGVLVPRLFALADRLELGLLRRLPAGWRLPLGFLLLDYSLYLWHWLNHKLPFLWRGHQVHHLDLDLDSSTGLRFHVWELTLTLGLRSAQILLLGVEAPALRYWNAALLPVVVFQHSNLRLPEKLEALLARVLVTPRMHGIHHDHRPEIGESNYSSLLVWWDWLHRTYREHPEQKSLVMGVQGHPDPTALIPCLLMPLCPA